MANPSDDAAAIVQAIHEVADTIRGGLGSPRPAELDLVHKIDQTWEIVERKLEEAAKTFVSAGHPGVDLLGAIEDRIRQSRAQLAFMSEVAEHGPAPITADDLRGFHTRELNVVGDLLQTVYELADEPRSRTPRPPDLKLLNEAVNSTNLGTWRVVARLIAKPASRRATSAGPAPKEGAAP
jgi:hypothetical protein